MLDKEPSQKGQVVAESQGRPKLAAHCLKVHGHHHVSWCPRRTINWGVNFSWTQGEQGSLDKPLPKKPRARERAMVLYTDHQATRQIDLALNMSNIPKGDTAQGDYDLSTW